MAEENKNIRLARVLKEYNVGITRILEFLSKKGYKIDPNPNTRISEEVYALLVKEFQSEKILKEEAKKIGFEYSSRETISIENIEKEKNKTEEEEPENNNIVRIKNTVLKDIKKTEIKIIDKVDLDEITKPKSKKTTEKKEVEPIAIEETTSTDSTIEPESIKEVVTLPETNTAEQQTTTPTPIIEIEESEVINDITSEETQIINPDELKQKLEVQPEIETIAAEIENKIKVVGKVDLSKLNQKIKPDKKSKLEKEKEKEAKKKAQLAEKELKIKEEKVKEEIVEQNPTIIEEPLKDISIKEELISTDEKQNNFIETQYHKLEGPKIIHKIDLEEFKKPILKKPQLVASSSDIKPEKKRPRIKEKNKVIESLNLQSKKEGKKWTKDEIKLKKKDFKEKKKPEVDESEIEKQLKETLARLGPVGKSKTSKHRREKRSQISQHLQEEQIKQMEEQKVLKVTEFVTANELATMMNVPVTSVISTCMSLGMFVSINQRLDAEALTIVADEFGYKVDFVSIDVLDAINIAEEEDKEEDLFHRAPIVAVMGHVDHGKTSLLDYIRHANVIAGEAGGITQHIGAYEVQLENGKKITFLDTPGHEAFTAMRARGAKVTDVAIIVVACDDRIMPQTVEAINHAQAAGVPIVFALNKIDKPNANPEKIKEELANMNILVEDWGGKYQSQEISAKKGTNLDLLLEKVLLEAELLDLKANPNKNALGTVIESSLDKGRGYVAKILVQNGTIKIGDIVLAGTTYGRVKAMYNERNQLVKSAGPSSPVLLLGLNGAPQAGDKFNVMTEEKDAKEISTKRLQLQREQGLRTQKHITLDEIGRRIAIGDFKQLNIIVKGDVDGSVEALSDSLLKLSTEEVQVQVIHKSVGQITESDVLLATASEAIIVGFQVRPSLNARKLAEHEQIDIRLYSIIYTAINEIKTAIEGMLSPEIIEKILCNIEVREIFKISRVGTIAGCMVLDGKITRNTKVRVIRDGIVVYTGKLGSLKRFKDDVREVSSNLECGLNIDNFNDIKVGDIIEGYEEQEIKRKL